MPLQYTCNASKFFIFFIKVSAVEIVKLRTYFLKKKYYTFSYDGFAVSLGHNRGAKATTTATATRTAKKSNRLRLAKQQLCTCITLFCTFFCRCCTTT